MTRTFEEIEEVDHPISVSPVETRDARSIQQHFENNDLDPIDAIYFQSRYFTDMYNLGLEGLFDYESRLDIDIIPFKKSGRNFFKILRVMIYYIDVDVQQALLEYNTPNVRCRELDPDTGEITDIISQHDINPYRMVAIPEPDGVSGNCYDIITITGWLERDTAYEDDLGGYQPPREYTNPATNAVISAELASQILNNDKAWWVAYREDFKKNIPYIPQPEKPHKYRELYEFSEFISNSDIIDLLDDSEYVNLVLHDRAEIGWYGMDEALARVREEGDIDYRFTYNKTLLHLVIENDSAHREIIELDTLTYYLDDTAGKVTALLDAGAQVDVPDMDGDTPLMAAAEINNIEIVEILIKYGADVNHQDDYGKTALIYAIDSGDIEMVEFIIEKGADVNLSDNTDETPLMVAVMYDDKTYARAVVKLLIAKGADVNAETEEGTTALMMGGGDRKIVEMLIDKGAKVNVMNTSGETPLSGAVEAGNIDLMKLLIDHGLDVNARDVNGATILIKLPEMLADDGVGAVMTKFLIDNNAEINVQDEQGFTALMIATFKDFSKTMNVLIAHGADIHLPNLTGKTAMDIAIDQDHSEARILLTAADLIMSMIATGLIS